MSDLHFGKADQAALDWFAAAVAAERPDAVIVTGDLTMRARSREYVAAAEWLTALHVPLSIEPGNHDLPYYNPFRRFFSPYRRFCKVERELERPLELPGTWLVPLRTTSRAQWRLNWAEGVVSRTSLRQAIARLREKPSGAVAIVACHHPLVGGNDVTARISTKGGREALDMLAQAGADAVLSGHVHDGFNIMWSAARGDIRMIGAGTLSERVRTTRPSFNELIVEENVLDVVAWIMP